MPARYGFEVYAGEDLGGDPIAELAIDGQLISGWYKHEARGEGEGQVSIHGDHADATADIFAQRNYLLFRRLDVAQDIGGFFLETGEFRALSRGETGGRVLTFGGPGALSILQRGILGYTPYAASPPASDVRGGAMLEGEWFWYAQEYGSILLRGVEEGQGMPGAPLAIVNPTFTRQEDSDGQDWDEVNTWRTPIGTTVRELREQFQRLGLVVHMDARFGLGAWAQMSDYAEDRTGVAFGIGTARFEGGVNIASELTTRIDPSLARSHVLVETYDKTYTEVTTGGAGVPFWGFLQLGETDDPATAELAGEFYLAQRQRMTRAYTVRHPIAPGDDAEAEVEAGKYAPAPDDENGDYWVGDMVTIHSGILEHDANELAIEVAAITFAHDAAGNWYAEAELGAQNSEGGGSDAGGGCTCPLPCRPGILETGDV